MTTKTKTSIIADLRAAADFLEEHPEVDAHCCGIMLNVWLNTREEMAAVARTYAPLKKRYTETLFVLRKDFGDNLCIEWNVGREKVCRLVETQETVTKPKVIVSKTETETVIVSKREWVCDEPLLADFLEGKP